MPLSIRLKDETEQQLNFLAKETGRTKAYYLRELIEGGIDELMDGYLALNVLERINNGKEKTYSQEEIEKKYGV